MKKLKTRDEWLAEGHSYDNEIEKARMMQGSASDLVEWAARKIAESRPENFKEGVISPIQEAKDSYKIMRLVNGRTKEMIEGTIGEIMDQFSSAIDKLRDSGSGKQYKDDPKTIEELVKYLNAAQSYIEKKDNPKNTYEIHESVNEASRWKGKEIYPNWVKPSDIEGFVKKESDLEVGRDYVLYEPGMDSWQAEYTYKGKIRGEYTFTSSSQFSTAPDERFTRKELDSMIKDLELAVMESEINERRKPITKKHWDKADDDQKEEWLLQAFSDPDDAMEYVELDWNDLPPQATSNMYESVNEAKDPVYKKGQKVNYQLYFQGGVGKYADAISKSKDVDTGVIRKRTKNKITGSFKYELTNGLELSSDEIVGLAESEVNEGQFSWLTHDGQVQIGSDPMNRVVTYMYDDKGNKWEEKRYEGYGEFGGKDYYDLVATMNGYTEEDLKDKKLMKKAKVIGKPELRQLGIAIAFDNLKPKTGKKPLFPALVTDPRYNWKRHDFEKEAESDPNQGWYDDEYGDDEYGYYESTNESIKGKLKALYKAAQKKFGKTKVVPPNDADYETAEKYIEMEYGKGHSLFAIGVDKIQDVINIQVGDDKTRETEDIVIDRPAENATNEADNWSDDVKAKWTPPAGLFTEPANKIADVLHKESDDLDQAMSRLQFYINRGGKLLDAKAKANLETAKKLLQQKYA